MQLALQFMLEIVHIGQKKRMARPDQPFFVSAVQKA